VLLLALIALLGALLGGGSFHSSLSDSEAPAARRTV
jgi:hypothetical protein